MRILRDSIIVENVTMSYRMLEEKVSSIKEYFIKFTKKKIKYRNFTALKNINFSIANGEVIGIIGYNGAGKSTLLKIISGVLKATSGKITINGKIAPLIELGAGFDIELTGRENIYLNGSLLGFSRKELNSKINEIIEFSELKEFIDVPLKNYSSGMYARLGFSIATLYEPEILIIDEILSVGDFNFQKKSFDKIKSMIDSGTTVIIVSHDMNQIQDLCSRVIWLEKGELKKIGDPQEICKEYIESSIK